MLQQYGQHIAQYLLAHPNWGGFITFIIAFSESLAIVGTIIPGSVTMTAVGLLVGTGIMPFGMTLLWAVLGAFLGDLLGYWIGVYYDESVRNMWPFKKHPNWLESGERFFQKHGGKSIIIGRFIGPVRSLIPLVAGLLHMSWQRFVLAAIPSATLWALAYMLPGILIGALSLQLPPGMATRFILFFFLIIVLLTLAGWSFKHIFLFLKKHTDRLLQNIWLSMRSSPRWQWLVRLLETKQDPESHAQLGLLILGLIALFCLIVTFISIKLHIMLALFNQSSHELLRSLRHPQGDKVMMAFTILGDGHVLFPAGFVILLWLLWCRNWRAGIHWLIILGIGLTVPVLCKHIIHSPRPDGLLHGPTNNSFPSGHTFLSVMYFGFLAALFATYLKNGLKTIPYYIAIFLVILIALSRMYLGAHWFTDVIGSICFGIFCICLILISYRRNITESIRLWALGIVICLATLISWSIYFVPHYHKMLINHTPIWPETLLSFDDWWTNSSEAIPLYRPSRLGKPAEPINIQWSADAAKVEQALIHNGWKKYSPKTDLTYIIAKVSATKRVNPLTHFAVYYNNHLPVTILMKRFKHKQLLVLRLWSSNVNFFDTNQSPLLLGILASYEQHVHSKDKIKYQQVLDKLTPDLKSFEWQQRAIPNDQQIDIPDVWWDGKILQIKSPTR